MNDLIRGDRCALRRADERDVDALVAIRRTPEVRARWFGDDLPADVRKGLADPDVVFFVVLDGDAVVGGIQYWEETDPGYRHAGIDVFLDPSRHGRGLGTDAVRALVRHLFTDVGHHRLVIDPAADNAAAIRCYEKVGFRPVGVMRQYERRLDGSWGSSLLMELLRDEFAG